VEEQASQLQAPTIPLQSAPVSEVLGGKRFLLMSAMPARTAAGILITGATGETINNSGTIEGGSSGAGIAINDLGSVGTSTITNTSTGHYRRHEFRRWPSILGAGVTLETLTNTGTIETGTGVCSEYRRDGRDYNAG